MWWTLACQAPFGTDRHDLVGFRVAAMALDVAQPGGTVTPEVALIVDGRAWSDDPVELRWFWVDGEDGALALDPSTPEVATGPAPTLTVPADRTTLALIARHGDDEYRAFSTVAPGPATYGGPLAVSIGTLPLDVEQVDGPDLQLRARELLPADPAETVDVGGFVRLTGSATLHPLFRWMATAGTFFELDRNHADWAAGDLHLDEDEIDDGRTTLDPGPVTFLALAIGAPGETTLRATDLYVGDEPPGLWVAGRYLPTDGEVAWSAGQAVRGTLVADDASPTGLRMVDGAGEPIPGDFGTGSLACSAPLGGPFDPRWLLTGICPRSGVDGVEVVVIPTGGR